jgi:hypothetical protein
VDTPGFNDTTRTERDILRELSRWLEQSYRTGVKLSGIIYLHRITDRRMQGSTLRNLYAFKKLCGDGGLRNVVLATTFWDEIDEKTGETREQQLCTSKDLWGSFIELGAIVRRLSFERSKALDLLLHLANYDQITIQLQQEIIEEGLKLGDTDVGKAVKGEALDALERKHGLDVEELRTWTRKAAEQLEHRAREAEAGKKRELQLQLGLQDEERRRVQQAAVVEAQRMEQQISQIAEQRRQEQQRRAALEQRASQLRLEAETQQEAQKLREIQDAKQSSATRYDRVQVWHQSLKSARHLTNVRSWVAWNIFSRDCSWCGKVIGANAFYSTPLLFIPI